MVAGEYVSISSQKDTEGNAWNLLPILRPKRGSWRGLASRAVLGHYIAYQVVEYLDDFMQN